MPPLPDTATLEALFNNRARVPEHGQIFQRWARASDAARAGTPGVITDLRYAQGDGALLDLYPPAPGTVAGEDGAPVLVFVHGGYWRSLDKAEHGFVAPAFNAQGVMVVVPNYALCPAVTIEHIVLQTAAAVAWTWRHAAAHGGDRRRIALVGHSAGAHLVSMMLSCRWGEFEPDLPPAPVTGGLGISGLYDLEPLRHVPSLQADLRLTPASVARLSPAFFPRPKAGRFYAVVGLDESDAFLRQNALIRDVWGPSTVPVCETVPDRNHFTVLEDLADPRARLHDLALRLLGLR
jgi:arylformamidase